MNQPKFSIIIPTYNRRTMLQRAVESVLAQRYTNWELVIVDDGSTDDTRDYIVDLNHDRINYNYQENKGRSSARNKGFKIAKGSYVCFLDSDDELLSNYLEVFEYLINDNEEEIYLTGVRLQNEKVITDYLPNRDREEYIVQCLEGVFNLMPFCFHRSKIKNEPFQTDLYYGEDFQFLIPTILKYQIIVEPQVSSVVHQHIDRTISKVFLDINTSYTQIKKSILDTIDENFDSLNRYMPIEKIEALRAKKNEDFILTAAKYNLEEAKKINHLLGENGINYFSLIIQRTKGLLQSWMT